MLITNFYLLNKMIQKYFLYFILAIQLSGNVGELYKKIEKRDLQNENIPSIATFLPAYIPEYDEDNSTSSVSLSIKTKSPPPHLQYLSNKHPQQY
ncbi:hypothetical protein Mgra_00008600 [Meloidogyne graminicola]|uniref:Uncharacterized protein n=1 Tax=Meloidogyne graminicola TaxID=189291 RepID=A0A8S9ZFD0_9BILA|nr:hypothetical protein Mgra_00008600 [Meloidogyne graminicola]